jgi:hypothetical protein
VGRSLVKGSSKYHLSMQTHRLQLLFGSFGQLRQVKAANKRENVRG